AQSGRAHGRPPRSRTHQARPPRAAPAARLPDRDGLRGLQRRRPAAARPRAQDGLRSSAARQAAVSKDLKNALAADRLSCRRYLADCFRLLLHAAAHRLRHGLRQAVRTTAPSLATAQFDTLRLQLLKLAAHVVQSVRRILVRLPRSFPLAEEFRAIALALGPTPAPS